MKFVTGSSLALTLVTASSASNLPACSSQPYKAALILSSYAPAQSFCTKAFPLPPVTATSTAATITSTTTAAAITQRVTGGAVTSAITEPAVTTIITEIVTSTSTATISTDIAWITETGAQNRRKNRARAATTNSLIASLWSSVSSRGSATLSTLCACIGTPVTTTKTITRKTTVGSTPTVYTTTTPIETTTVVPTSTSTSTSVKIISETEYITITSTTTITPTATATPAPNSCQSFNDGVYNGFQVLCGYDTDGDVPVATHADDYSQCIDLCAKSEVCNAISYVGRVIEGRKLGDCYLRPGEIRLTGGSLLDSAIRIQQA